MPLSDLNHNFLTGKLEDMMRWAAGRNRACPAAARGER